MVTNALTFDVEEWYHPEAIRTSNVFVDKRSQVVQATRPLLHLLREYETHATFFTVGEVAADHPHLIEQILSDGHELAFHGWTHKPLWELSPTAFTAELDAFLDWCKSHFPGVPILGYRAPTFSLDRSTAWAVGILQAHDFVYDSSIFPAHTPLYGVPDAPTIAYTLTEDNLTTDQTGGLLEIPMSVFPLLGQRVGFTGGLYLRSLPWYMVRQMIEHMNQDGQPAVMYIHPWETYAATPRVDLSRWGKFVLYHGMPVFDKLEKLLQTFQFDSMEAIFYAPQSAP